MPPPSDSDRPADRCHAIDFETARPIAARRRPAHGPPLGKLIDHINALKTGVSVFDAALPWLCHKPRSIAVSHGQCVA
jgi:hypothetical protein